MARHRAASWVPERLQHLGWATWLVLLVCAVVGVACGFACCVGWKVIGG